MYRSHEWAANYPCGAFAGLSWRLIYWKQSAVLRVNFYKDYFNHTNCGLLNAMTFTRQVIVSALNSWMPPEPSSHCSFHVICNDVLFYGIYLQIMQSLFWNTNKIKHEQSKLWAICIHISPDQWNLYTYCYCIPWPVLTSHFFCIVKCACDYNLSFFQLGFNNVQA